MDLSKHDATKPPPPELQAWAKAELERRDVGIRSGAAIEMLGLIASGRPWAALEEPRRYAEWLTARGGSAF